jgi:hypothetical protein
MHGAFDIKLGNFITKISRNALFKENNAHRLLKNYMHLMKKNKIKEIK